MFQGWRDSFAIRKWIFDLLLTLAITSIEAFVLMAIAASMNQFKLF